MAISVRFNEFIERINVLERPTVVIGKFFEKHATAYKIALIVNHLFRAMLMIGLMFIPYVPIYASMPICFVGSIFYRLTVEKNCAYKFALPSFFGAAAFMLALPAFISMINGVAFTTVAVGFANCASFLPLLLYGTYIGLTVNYEVNKTQEQLHNKKSCCKKKEEQVEPILPQSSPLREGGTLSTHVSILEVKGHDDDLQEKTQETPSECTCNK